MDQVDFPFSTAAGQPRRDFRTRRVPLRARMAGWVRRLAVVVVAVAVPALAAPGTIAALQSDPANETLAPMPFESPGHSFPGSAFYYLEDAPQMVEAAGREDPAAMIGQAALENRSHGASPLIAAAPLRMTGTDQDHARAQQCMTQAIYYEAASESDAGQRAVAQVVLNRVAHRAYPRSVCGVVYQGSERRTGCQFTFTCDGSLARRPSQASWNRASRIAREALAGVVYAPVGTATHYHTLAVNPYWASSLDTVGVIGAHIFYRWRGSTGRPAAFNAGYAGNEPAPGRARAETAPAPDPVSPPALSTYASISPPDPVVTSAPPAAATVTDTANVAPRSGDVRSEYANSGRWIARP